jgi:hypothetical protein
MSRRTIVIVVGALALLLAVTPFVPRGDDDDGSLLPSGDGKAGALQPARTAGFSRITPAMQAEIDRVVNAGRVLGRVTARTAPDRLADDLVRCATFEGQRYCLGTGWTEDTEDQAQARMATATRRAAAARSTGAPVLNTGDLDARGVLERRAAMDPAARARADRAELTAAARSVAKVWLLRHDIEGVPLPAGFLADHPEARAAGPTARTDASAPTRSTVKTQDDYPDRAEILDPKQVAEQRRTYWCGPTTMQMIAWGWQHRARYQRHWANRLNTTTSGTAIWDMVRVVNGSTGWDRERRAGPYVVLDIGHYTYAKWMLLMMRHLVDYRAPVVLHPILHKQYYPYLDDDASGHFQVGRGYAKRGDRSDLLGYFEPWNQQRFDPSEPYISRVQWRSAYRSFRANKAHFQHNLGV